MYKIEDFYKESAARTLLAEEKDFSRQDDFSLGNSGEDLGGIGVEASGVLTMWFIPLLPLGDGEGP